MNNTQIYKEVNLKDIRLNPNNPRKNFSGKKFEELVVSVREKGVLEPIILRELEDGFNEVVAGERRFKALSQVAGENGGIDKWAIPAIIRELSDDEAFDIMIIENLHREDLGELEEAEGFKAYLDKKGEDHLPALADRTGIDPRYIRRRIAVLSLPKNILKAWDKGEIRYGHLEQLLRVKKDKERLMELFEDILDRFDGPMTVQKLKSEIDSEAITLDKAFFSDFKNSCCFKCGKNSDVQKSLFDISMDKTMCLDPKCFRKNQTDWLKNNWPEARKKLNVATNGFVLNNDFNFSGSNTFTGDKTPVDCKKCDNFVSLLWDDYTVNRKRVCTGDKTCFKKTTVSDKNKSVDKSDLSGSGKESTGPRVAWHGEYFREEFYKTAIPENWPQLPDNLFRFKMLLLSLLKSNRSLQEWFAKTHKIRFNYGFISTAQLLKPINDMSEEQLLETVRDAAREVVMQSDFGAKDRRTVAEYIGIDLKIQWRITEEYLQKKTIKEILSMGKKFLIFEDKKAQDYLYEILGKKRGSFDTCKKAELIKVFIESGVDLAGKVPDEILNK